MKPTTPTGKLKTAEALGVKSVFHDSIEGADPQLSPWFRGRKANRNPSLAQLVPATAAADFVIKGWGPETPVIDKSTRITAFGSCFAANISQWLGRRNYRVSTEDPDAQDAYVVRIGEGMVNSFVIRQQFEWAWENRSFEEALWHGYDKEVYGYDESIRLQTKELFDSTDLFVLTFGLSEVWYDTETDNVFWRTVPKKFYDPKRHKFRVTTVEENRDNINAIYALIRKHRPDAKIIITLSPVPLIATFRDESCITANSVSKAILRVAIDEVLRAHKDDGYLYYWPSYELIVEVFRSAFIEDRRHIKPRILDFIMTQFEHTWCKDEDGSMPSLLEAWIIARVEVGLLPRKTMNLVKRRSVDDLMSFMDMPVFTNTEDADESREMLLSLIEEWRATGRARAPKAK